MTKLIALLAVFFVLALGVTTVASWITKKKAPLALAAGRTPAAATEAEESRAMSRALLRTVAGLVFSVVMFAALLRVTIGMSEQQGVPIALTAGRSACGGLLLYCALPAAKLTGAAAARPLLSRRAFILPAALLTAFAAFVAACFIFPQYFPGRNDAVALLALSLALLGSTVAVLHRLRTTVSLQDARMADLDRRWREVSAATMVRFGNGSLMACFGSAAALAGVAPGGAAVPVLATAVLAGSAALACASVVLLVMAAKGAWTIRRTVRQEPKRPVQAG